MPPRRAAHEEPALADDPATVAFLQWALPRLGLRWGGYRKVRGTVRKRLTRRLRALGLPDLSAYREHLEAHPDEWGILEAMCRIPISRFHRDRAVFERLTHEILPALSDTAAREERSSLRVWSAGCASGEEPYTIAILWHLVVGPAHPALALELLATDVSEEMIVRAERGIYSEGSLRELPAELRERAFVREANGEVRVRDELRRGVVFRREDLRASMPEGPFDLILCRNLAFTYFDEPTQLRTAEGLASRLRPGGALVVGCHEALPADVPGLVKRAPSIYERHDCERHDATLDAAGAAAASVSASCPPSAVPASKARLSSRPRHGGMHEGGEAVLNETDLRHLRRCVELATEAVEAGDEPFGSVLVAGDGTVLAEERNRIATLGDPTRHPELDLARWAAARLTPEERAAATVYTSGEHCPMCAAAHGWVGLGRIVYASSAEQLVTWSAELGGTPSPSPVRPLPIREVVPALRVDGPAPELAEPIRALHERARKARSRASAKPWKPTGYNSASPYIVASGAQKVIDFAKAAFGAEPLRRYDMPDGSIAHAELRIDDSIVMVADARPGSTPSPALLHVYVPDVDATFQRALDAGATAVQAPKSREGDPDKRGLVKDACGNTWSFGTQLG